MYVANHFRIPQPILDELLSTVRFGTLVTVHADGPIATPVPFYVEKRGDQTVAVTHLVRNNPHAREAITGPGLVLLNMADAYVSPAWYATNEAMPNVPTWDYITVQIRGAVKIDLSPERALHAAKELTRRMGEEWCLEQVGSDKLEKMAHAIVGVEVVAEEIVGKAKMTQNRHPEDVASLIEQFDADGKTQLAEFLREVSLPYATERFALMARTREGYSERNSLL